MNESMAGAGRRNDVSRMVRPLDPSREPHGEARPQSPRSRLFGVVAGLLGLLLAGPVVAAVSPPTFAKAFGAASIVIGQTTSLTFTIHNPNAGTTLTNVAVSDGLPGGLLVANPNGLGSNCGGNVNAVPGSSFISMDTVTLAPLATCAWSINVVATFSGAKDNVTNQISSTESGTGTTASASINVPVPPAPTLAKAFGAASIAVGQTTSLTFTLANPSATFTTLTNVTFADSLPGGLLVANPNGLAGNCGGNVNAGPGSSFIAIDTVTLAPAASCTWSINVVATSAGTKDNVTGVVSSTQSGNGSTASASITVLGPAQVLSEGSRKTHSTAGTFDLLLAP